MTEETQKQQELQEKNRETVRKWYHGHSEEYNDLRRQRYAEDKEVREKARQRAREYRNRRRKGASISSDPVWRYVNGSGACDYGHGRRIRVWSTGQIAEIIGATPQMLRNWERKGWIPDSIFPDKHRLYTGEQVNLIVEFAGFMKQYRAKPSKYKGQLAELIDNIKEQWMNYEFED